jgi:hypothetical protein
MVDNFSHHQTWPPPLLKIEYLTKKWKNYTKKSCKEQSLEAIAPSHNFSGFFLLILPICSTFNNNTHVG